MCSNEQKRDTKISTIAVHGSKGVDPLTGAVSFPIYQSATFRHPALGESTGYDYSRLQNPTREELEATIAKLEGGVRGFAYASGMAGIANLLELFSPGDHLLVSDDQYGGTYRLFEEIGRKNCVSFDYVDTSDAAAVEAGIRENTRGLFVETPTNPMMKIADLRVLCSLAHRHDILVIVDNTFLTPYFQRPLTLGADIVTHSGTKYLGGHNDTLAGLVAVRDEAIGERLALYQKTIGAQLAPFDSWLILRGIKTLHVRLDRQQENAFRIAEWLRAHPKVAKVFYIGLPEHPGHDIAKAQSSGFGAMISFHVADPRLVAQVLGRVKLILFAESLGGVETLITYPMVQTHAAIPEETRNRIGVTDTLLRLSVGIEDVEDLIADLAQALGE